MGKKKNRVSLYLAGILTVALLLTGVLMLSGCDDAEEAVEEAEEIVEDENYADDSAEPVEEKAGDKYRDVTRPVATIEMENGDVIRVELEPAIAPNTVKNFIALASEEFYDGLIFHRVVPGFVIQGGCPLGQGTGNPGYSIKGEFLANGFDNPLRHERGVISMARSNQPDSAGSQFFIMVADSEQLDGQYAAFGTVIEGMEAVDRIVGVERNQNDKPLEDQVIKSISVDTFGVDYPLPDTL